jgi:hypothetical protein
MSNDKQITDMTWDEYGNPKPPTGRGDNMNNNPGNTDNNLKTPFPRSPNLNYRY